MNKNFLVKLLSGTCALTITLSLASPALAMLPSGGPSSNPFLFQSNQGTPAKNNFNAGIYFCGQPQQNSNNNRYGPIQGTDVSQPTPFRKSVLEIVQTIPFGQTMIYGGIANHIAKQRGLAKMSAQAVGRAVGRNPILLIIPCQGSWVQMEI